MTVYNEEAIQESSKIVLNTKSLFAETETLKHKEFKDFFLINFYFIGRYFR